jgi:carbamoyl-phosphate synthase large subunit
MRVLMSAAASPAAWSIVRHLQGLGHHVTGIDAAADVAPLGEAVCDVFRLAPLAADPAYIPFLIERLADVDVFLPFIDEELMAIAEASLPSSLASRVALSPPESLRECVDKQAFQRRCEQEGLPVAPRAEGPPAFFKPRFGRGGKGVLLLDDEPLFAAMRGRDGVIQRRIRGTEYTVDAIFDGDGRLLATSSRKRLRAAGVSTVGDVEFDPALHALADRLGRVWSFRYAINFQVIRDDDGNDWLIELNPRLAGSALFSAFAGCDPIAATIALATGARWEPTRPRALRVWRHWSEWTQPEHRS